MMWTTICPTSYRERLIFTSSILAQARRRPLCQGTGVSLAFFICESRTADGTTIVRRDRANCGGYEQKNPNKSHPRTRRPPTSGAATTSTSAGASSKEFFFEPMAGARGQRNPGASGTTPLAPCPLMRRFDGKPPEKSRASSSPHRQGSHCD